MTDYPDHTIQVLLTHIIAGVPAEYSNLATQADLKDLSVRRGLTIYNTTGDLVWYDDFEHGNQVWEQLAGTLTINTSMSYWGGRCLQMLPAAGVGQTAKARKMLMLPDSGKWGFAWFMPCRDKTEPVDGLFDFLDGANEKRAYIRVNPNAGTLQYLDSAGAWQNIASGLSFVDDAQMWYYFKLILDIDDWKYHTLQLNNTSYSIPYAMQSFAKVEAAHMEMAFQTKNRANAGSAYSQYIDMVAVTKNE